MEIYQLTGAIGGVPYTRHQLEQNRKNKEAKRLKLFGMEVIERDNIPEGNIMFENLPTSQLQTAEGFWK